MKQFTLDLNENIQRPVSKLSDWHQFDVMLDTGALFPVWVSDEDVLKKLGAERIKENVTFGGFGGVATGNLYRLNFCRYYAYRVMKRKLKSINKEPAAASP